MSFTLRTPRMFDKTDIQFKQTDLEAGTCGLFRAPLHQAASMMPSMAKLIASVPVSRKEDYEIDIKVHMLMVGQYPCIPNWHTDMVPRDESGLRFDLVTGDERPMLLWISDGPETEFLAEELVMNKRPGSHQEIATFIRYGDQEWRSRQAPQPVTRATQRIQPNHWYTMDQQTPHRGMKATKGGWRVFARVTHKSLAPARPVTSVIRRHAQVYLDASTFSW